MTVRPTPLRSRPRRASVRAVAAALALALVAAACSVDGSTSPDSTTPSTTPAARVLQATFQPLTGLRSGAPTVVAAAFANTTADPQPATFTIDDLPDGTTLASVTPDAGAPQDGWEWACSATTCQLADATGAPTTVPAGAGAHALIALDTPAGVDPSATISVSLGGDARTVPLALPDGQPAVADVALGADVGGPTTVLIGDQGVAQVVVTNLSGTPAPGGATVSLSAPTIDGVTVSAAGSGWTCAGLVCTYATALAPSSATSALAVTIDAPTGITGGTGTLGIAASASVTGGNPTASDTLDVTIRAPRSTGVSTRLQVSPASTPAPGQVTADVSITATGQGTLGDPVSFGLRLPEGVTADWDQVQVDGWTCSSQDATCQTPGPLTAGQPVVVPVPLTVAADAPRVTAELEVTATVESGTDGGDSRETSSKAAMTIVAPPVPEIRAALALGGQADGPPLPAGAPLLVDAGRPAALSVEVANAGSATALVGSTVHVTAVPDAAQRISSVGGDGWHCDVRPGDELSHDRPLHCDQMLTGEMAGGASIALPLTVDAMSVDAAPVTWSVGAGLDPESAAEGMTTAQVQVTSDSALLVTDVVEASPLYDGGSGEVSVITTNHGSQPATGSVVVIAVPGDVSVNTVYAPQWSCVDTSLAGANGTVTCATTWLVEPGASAPRITLDVAPTAGTRSVRFGAWGAADGQPLSTSTSPGRTVELPVAGSLHVDAGTDLTVVTPQTAADGSPQPAVVVLTGDADLASARDLAWTQLCTQQGEQGCDGVDPAVTWLGVPAGATPTTATASFTAPTITGPQQLEFQLTGQVGSEAISDQVTVNLVPAGIGALVPPTGPPGGGGSTGGPAGGGSSASAGSGTSSSGGAGGSTGSGGSSGSGGADGTTTTTAAPPAPTASIATAGTALQVPTEATGQLVGTGTGVGTLTYQWNQTAGPSATIEGSSAIQPTLQFTAPLLDPDEDGATLSFELTVTDGVGATATASAQVQVVWGDDGLQVTLANGAPNVVASVGGPITVTSAVASRGAPYTYSWSVDDLTLPSGTATNGPTLQFVAGTQPADGTATLEVTDSFGRQTSVSIPVVVSGLPAGQLPTAFCAAVASLSAGKPASLTGAGVSVTVPAATLSGAPASPCSASTIASFTGASATLPGGVSVTGATGQLTVAGVQLSSGPVAVPANWALTSPGLGSGGLLAPFVSATAISAPSGAVTGSGLPLVGLSGWTGTTTVTFTASPAPSAVLSAQGTGPSSGTSVQLDGTATGSGTSLTLAGEGLVTVGTVVLPVSGTLSTSSAAGPTTFDTSATLPAPVALGADTTLSSATLAWTPAQASGPVSLLVGAGPGAVTLAGQATSTTSGTTMAFPEGSSRWTPVPGTDLTMSGSGSVTGGQLTLSLQSEPVASVPVGHDLAVTDLTGSLAADCPLDASQACAPTLTLSGTATSALFAAPSTVSGQVVAGTQGATLTGTVTSATVAPMVVTDVALSVGLGAGGTPSATATGTTTVLGASAPTTVTFTDDTTLADASIGTQPIATGWTIDDAQALATTAATTWSPSDGPIAGQASVALAPGELYVAGPSQLPATLSDGVLPADATTALASTTVAATATTLTGPYTLDTPIPSTWYVAGTADTPMAATIDTVTFTVTPTATGTTVAVAGTGSLVTEDLDGSAGATLPLVITAGQLGLGTTGAVLTATLSASGPWVGVLGTDGLDASGVAVSVTITGGASTATLTAQASLPAALGGPLGVPSGATPTLTTDFDGQGVCASVDLASGGATGVDFGGAGLVVASSAYLVLAPQGCTTSSVAVPSGVTLLIDGSYLGLTQAGGPASASLSVDPTTFAIDDSITGVSATIGGLALTAGTIDVQTTGGTTAMTVSGQASVDGTTLDFTGPVTMPAAPGDLGTLALVAQPGDLAVGGLAVSDATVTVTGPSSVGNADGTVSVTGSTPLLGTNSALDLSGTLVSGTITQLSQTLPTTTYPLWSQAGSGDSLVAGFTIAYDSTQDPTLQVSAGDATLTTPTQSFPGTSATIVDGTTLDLTTTVQFLGDGVLPAVTVGGLAASLSGTYTYAGDAAGAYELTTTNAVAGTLAGIPQSATITFQRTFSGSTPTEAGTQSSVLTTGVFDNDPTITVSGPLSTTDPTSTTTLDTPTASPTPVALRGLSGTAALQVSPSPLATATSRWFQIAVTMDTDSGECDLWSGDPTLKGQIYRSGTTSYYTLTGTTTPILPFGIVALGAATNQPLLITNEVLPGSSIPADAISLNFPLNGGTFSADAQFTFGLADCSYSVGGSVNLTFSGGEAAAAMVNALTPPAGASTSLNDLFGPAGALPQNLSLQRSQLQWEAMQATFTAQAAAAQQAADAAQAGQQQAQQDVNTASDQAATANAQLATAQETYDQLLAQYGTAADQAEFADQFPLAEAEIGDAQAALDQARSQLTTATTALTAANTKALAASYDLGSANDALVTATDQADAATDAANSASQQAQDANQARLVQITLQLTYCRTCTYQYSGTFDGEIYFGGTWIAELDASLSFSDSASSWDLTVTAGPEFVHSVGWDWIGATIDASLLLSISVGHTTDGGWVNLTAALDASAQVDAWISVMGYSATADLLSINILGQLQFLPVVTATGSYSFEVFHYDLSGSWSDTWT